MSDIDTAMVVDSLKALDPKRPIREADLFWVRLHVSKVPNSDIVPLYPECGVFLYSCQRRSVFRMHILSSLTTRTCKMNMESCYEHHSNSGFST